MAVDAVSGSSNMFNELLTTQTSAVPNNSDMSMDDFWQLFYLRLVLNCMVAKYSYYPLVK